MGEQISLWDLVFISFGYMFRSGIAGSYSSSIFNFLRNSPYCFPQWLNQFTFPPAVLRGSLISMYLQALVISYFSGNEKQNLLIVLMSVPLYLLSCFSLAAFKIFSLSFNFWQFNYNGSWGSLWIHLIWNSEFPESGCLFLSPGYGNFQPYFSE